MSFVFRMGKSPQNPKATNYLIIRASSKFCNAVIRDGAGIDPSNQSQTTSAGNFPMSPVPRGGDTRYSLL